jgi:LacI family transcriptional regulator
MVGIADIAKDVGVSMSLVSKVLSGRMGKSSVRPELAAEIHAKAKQVGYVTNATARALVTGRQNVVGVFISRHGQPGSGLVEALIDGVASELAKHQQGMRLQFFHSEPDFEACLAVAHRNILDGVVVAGAPHFDLTPKLQKILDQRVPVATMFDAPVSPEIPNAGLDQMEVGRIATRHLIEQNCTRPVFLRVAEPVASLRFKGYRRALEESGLPYRPELVCSLRTYEPTTVPRLIEGLLNLQVPFDGVIAESDLQSSAVLRTLLSAGKRVPTDIKLIGIDDAPVCKFGVIHLSSVSGQDRKRAELAVKLLKEVIEGHPPRSLTLPPVVMARESSGNADLPVSSGSGDKPRRG